MSKNLNQRLVPPFRAYLQKCLGVLCESLVYYIMKNTHRLLFLQATSLLANLANIINEQIAAMVHLGGFGYS